jgi:diguanylate cyclase (GGDEF)-like protein
MEPFTDTPPRILARLHTPEIRSAIHNALSTAGFQIDESADSQRLLDQALHAAPDLILLEIQHQDSHALRRLRESPATQSIPVILVAPQADSRERARGLDEGAADFLVPPFEPDEFLAKIRVALRTKSLIEILEERAHLDALTGLWNRHALELRLAALWHESAERRASLAVLMFDLDHFKSVNDQFGHSEGDRLLRTVATDLRRSVRPSDCVARFGGEEFVVVAPDCDRDAALAIAARFRRALDKQSLPPLEGRSSQITTSAGVAVATPASVVSSVAARETQVLLAEADQALYQAKANGRNAVWYWDRTAGAARRLIASADAS